MPIVTLALYRRPGYTRQVLEALAGCHEIGRHAVLASADFFNADVSRTLAKMTREVLGSVCEVQCIKQPRRLGCTGNTIYCLDWGFSREDYVVHCEDDIVFSKDALHYFNWGRQFQGDQICFSISAYNKDDAWPVRRDEASNVYPSFHFTPWGWATWKDRWAALRRKILEVQGLTWGRRLSWGPITNRYGRADRCELRPRVARSRNIGALQGTYCPGAEFHRLRQDNVRFFADALGVDCQRFEVESESVPCLTPRRPFARTQSGPSVPSRAAH